MVWRRSWGEILGRGEGICIFKTAVHTGEFRKPCTRLDKTHAQKSPKENFSFPIRLMTPRLRAALLRGEGGGPQYRAHPQRGGSLLLLLIFLFAELLTVKEIPVKTFLNVN